jgi:diaminopimelate decarboxylase/aspartate kinase
MDIKVLKFGGSSQKLKTYEMIKEIIENNPYTKYVIVLSAITGITNSLLSFPSTRNFNIWKKILERNNEFSKECIHKLTQFNIDMENKLWDLEKDKIEIVAMGEFFTTNILHEYLQLHTIKSKFISSFDCIQSNQPNIGDYNKGEFTVNSNLILDTLKSCQVVIIPGFSGISSTKQPCLLGRGGSDTSGSIIAASINALQYEIWTDVNGIYSCDPRHINNTKIIENISYNQSQEIAAMGAKVIHPYCILPCARKNIPIVIRNTFHPDAKIITKISNHKCEDNNIKAITLQNSVNVCKITSQNMWNNYGFVYEIFSIFKKYNVDVNIINTSQFNITTTTDENNLENLFEMKEELSKLYDVELLSNNTIVSIIGNNIRKFSKIGELFQITQTYDILLTSYSSNDMTLSWVISSEKSIDLAQNLHNLIFN